MKELLDILANRASVRSFDTSKPLPRETIDRLLSAAAQAPNTGNMQLYSVVVTTEPESLARMKDLHFGQPMAGECGAMLTFCADLNRFGKWCEVSGTKSGLDNRHGLLLAVMDATIFAEQFVCAAESMGLGSCYLGTVTYNVDAFVRELDLPAGVLPLFSVVVGWPKAEPAGPTERLPLEAVVHYGKYHDYSDADIRRLYSEKEAREDSARFIAENGKQSLAQVFAEVRYPRAMNEKISADLEALVSSWPE